MAISLIQSTKRIFVPKSDLTLVSASPDIRSIDVNFFHNELRTLETLPENDVFEITHTHNTVVTIGNVVLSRVMEILPPWNVEFEEVGLPYAVRIVGGNTNIEERSIVNNVSIRPQNSAGLQQVTSGSGVLPSDVIDIRNAIFEFVMENAETFADQIRLMRAEAAGSIERTGNIHRIKSADGTKDRIVAEADQTSRTAILTDGT